MGQDKDSGEIWSDYIQFLRSGEVCYDRLLSSCSEIWNLNSCSSYLTFNSSLTPFARPPSDLARVRVMDMRPRFGHVTLSCRYP